MNLENLTATLSDKDLIEEYCLTQSDHLFNALYSRYEHKIYGKCITMFKDTNLAKEAMQEIFIKIFLNLSKFEGKSKFSTWVYSITYNHCIDSLRKIQRKNSKIKDTDTVPEIVFEVEDKELLEIKFQILDEILLLLKAKDKAILLMKYRDDIKIQDIAEILKVSESAVKMRLKRATEKAVSLHRELYNLP